MPIMEDQMRRIVGTQAHTHQMLDTGLRPDHHTRIQHIDDRTHGKQVELWRRDRCLGIDGRARALGTPGGGRTL